MQLAELHSQCLVGLQHGLRDALQHGMTCHQGAHPRRKLPFADLAHLEPEAAQKTPQAELHVAHFGLQLLARDQERPNLLGGRRLAVHRSEPAHAQQLGDAAGVLAVGLDDHRRERRLHVAGLEQHRLKTGFDQSGLEPLRQRPGFQADAHQRQSEAPQKGDQRRGLAGDLGLAHDPAGGVDHAHAALFQRHVNPGIVIHGCPSLCLGPITSDPVSNTSL
jgi:hypothetical protein